MPRLGRLKLSFITMSIISYRIAVENTIVFYSLTVRYLLPYDNASMVQQIEPNSVAVQVTWSHHIGFSAPQSVQRYANSTYFIDYDKPSRDYQKPQILPSHFSTFASHLCPFPERLLQYFVFCLCSSSPLINGPPPPLHLHMRFWA